MRFRELIVAACGAALVFTMASAVHSLEDGYAIATDKEGNIRVPDVDYRALWQFLGTFSERADDGSGAGSLHNVYTQTGVIEAYRKTGTFPDGAVLIKDIFFAATKDMPTGTISYATKLEGSFVMVKDTKGRFKKNPLWGDGWGWAWFDAGSPTKTTTTNYKKDCIGCHLPVENQDWIHTQAYPTLKGER